MKFVRKVESWDVLDTRKENVLYSKSILEDAKCLKITFFLGKKALQSQI